MKIVKLEFFTSEDVLVDSISGAAFPNGLTKEVAIALIEHEANKNEAIEYGVLHYEDGLEKMHFVTGN
jgi:ribosomal protein L1